MIIFQTKKPVENLSTNCVGVTGDNLAHTQEFYIKEIYDSSLAYSIHLRFADGSVNTVIPDTVQHDGEGTGLRWVVKKNDIFMHGYFELQIEGRNDDGLVFQTEIVELYADESIPVEDKQYENPNSETIKLRDEAYELVQSLSEQQTKLEENAKLLEQYDLDNKLDDNDGVVKSNHIADYAVTTQKLDDGAVTTDKIEFGAVGEDELNPQLLEKINSKLDNAVGVIQTEHIADKAVSGDKIKNGTITGVKLSKSAVSGSNIAQNQISSTHIINGEILKSKLSVEVINAIDSKYEASNIEHGLGTLSTSETHIEKINSATFEYQKVGNWVDVHVYVDFKAFSAGSSMSITFTGLPFVCKNKVNPREMCVTNKKKQMLWAIATGSASITLLFFENSTIVENEILSFSFRYKIV